MSTATGRNRREVGARAEDFTAEYLTRTLGWQIQRRNWRCRAGELDIVALDRRELVVVEVRSRSGVGFGSAEESVVGAKLLQLRRLLPFLLRDLYPGAEDVSVRVDVVAIGMRGDEVQNLSHIRRALDGI